MRWLAHAREAQRRRQAEGGHCYLRVERARRRVLKQDLGYVAALENSGATRRGAIELEGIGGADDDRVIHERVAARDGLFHAKRSLGKLCKFACYMWKDLAITCTRQPARTDSSSLHTRVQLGVRA